MLFITLVFSFVLFTVVVSSARLADEYMEYSIIKNNTLEDAYFLARMIAPEDLRRGGFDKVREETFADLMSESIIDKAYTTIVASYFEIEGSVNTLMIYDQGLLDAFPYLKKTGVVFSDDPFSCVLSDKAFNGVKTGEKIEAEILNSNGKVVTFTVSGHLVSPYKHLSFGGSGTYLNAGDLFINQETLMVRNSKELIDSLGDNVSYSYYPDILFTFKDDASKAEIEAVLSRLNMIGVAEPLSAIIERTGVQLESNAKNALARPVVFMFASTTAYFSLIVLMIKKKARQISVMYLCGASLRDIVSVIVGVCVVVAAVPAIVNTIFISVAPELDWRGALAGYSLDELYITPDLIWIVVLYLAVTLAVAGVSVVLSVGNKPPLKYLRSLD